MLKTRSFMLLIPVALAFTITAHSGERLDLSGDWQVKLDRADEGENQRWAAKPLDSAQSAKLPGSLTSNGIGDDITLKTPWMGDASSVTDHTQGNWNGIVGKIELSAHSPVTIVSQQVYPKNDGTLRVKLDLSNTGREAVQSAIRTHLML